MKNLSFGPPIPLTAQMAFLKNSINIYIFIRHDDSTEQIIQCIKTYTQTVKISLHKKDRYYMHTIIKTSEKMVQTVVIHSYLLN